MEMLDSRDLLAQSEDAVHLVNPADTGLLVLLDRQDPLGHLEKDWLMMLLLYPLCFNKVLNMFNFKHTINGEMFGLFHHFS